MTIAREAMRDETIGAMASSTVHGEDRATTEAAGASVERGRFRPTSERRLDWAIGALVLVAYGLLQAWLLQGPRPWDPTIYFNAAVSPADAAADLFTLRIGLLAPLRVAVFLFGPSEAALYAVPFAFGLLLTAAIYGTTLVLFRDRWLAAGAALVTTLSASYLLNSSFIFPDTAATATFSAGFLCLLLGATTERGPRWMAAMWAAGAGFLFGWTVLIREFTPILVPSVLAALILLHYPWRRAGLLALVASATVALDPLYTLARYGDPLLHARLLVVARPHRPISAADRAQVERFHDELGNVFDTVAVFPRLLLTWRAGWVLLLFVALFVAALVIRRDRRLYLLAAWFFSVWAFMAVIGLGSLPSGRWILNITNVRYWYPLLPPLVMGGLAGAYLLAQRFAPRLRGVPVVTAITASLAAFALVPAVVEFNACAAKDVWASEPAARWHELRSWLASSEAQSYRVVLTDKNTSRLLPAFTNSTFGDPLWRGDIRGFVIRKGIVRPPRDQQALVLIDKDRFRLDSTLSELRDGWSPAFVSEDGMMVVLAHASTSTSNGAEPGEAWWHVPDDFTKRRLAHGCGTNPYRPPAG
jgi:hypothetical protein